MADGYVQVPLDSTGKKVDTAELTRADGTVIERQRVVISGNADLNMALDPTDVSQLLTEARRHTALLRSLVLQLSTLTGVPLTEEDTLGD